MILYTLRVLATLSAFSAVGSFLAWQVALHISAPLALVVSFAMALLGMLCAFQGAPGPWKGVLPDNGGGGRG